MTGRVSLRPAAALIAACGTLTAWRSAMTDASELPPPRHYLAIAALLSPFNSTRVDKVAPNPAGAGREICLEIDWPAKRGGGRARGSRAVIVNVNSVLVEHRVYCC